MMVHMFIERLKNYSWSNGYFWDKTQNGDLFIVSLEDLLLIQLTLATTIRSNTKSRFEQKARLFKALFVNFSYKLYLCEILPFKESSIWRKYQTNNDTTWKLVKSTYEATTEITCQSNFTDIQSIKYIVYWRATRSRPSDWKWEWEFTYIYIITRIWNPWRPSIT